MDREITYLLRRSEEEAVRSAAAGEGIAAAVHGELCLLYTGRALAAMLTRCRR